MTEKQELKVFIAMRDSACDECGEKLGRDAWIMLAGERGALCLACADLEHLVFLPSGDPALTRRARKHSKLSADHTTIVRTAPVMDELAENVGSLESVEELTERRSRLPRPLVQLAHREVKIVRPGRNSLASRSAEF